MKKIVSKVSTEEIDINEINNDSVVGIIWADIGKSWIVDKDDDCFVGTTIGEQDIGFNWDTSSKKQYCIEAMRQEETQLFLFSNKEELIEWLKK